MTETRKVLDNNQVEITTVDIVPRYVGKEEYSECACDCIIEDFKSNNKVWITSTEREGFKYALDTKEDWEPEGNNIEDDIESFQKYLDETYGEGKYEAYALGAYIHSAVSFAFNKGEDTRCRWDSGTVGFVGISKELTVDLNQYASQLSDAWNGWIQEIYIYDNFEQDVVDSIYSTESNECIKDWKDRMEQAYGVTKYEQKQ